MPSLPLLVVLTLGMSATITGVDAMSEVGYGQKILMTNEHDVEYQPKVAIVGGGIAGATASYYLQDLTRSIAVPPSITVFERDNTLGGHVASIYAHGAFWQNVEAGAEAFSSNDWCVARAASEAGLSPVPYREAFGQEFSIWNGKTVVTRGYALALYPKTWSDWFRAFWKYGLAVVRTKYLVDQHQAKFQSFTKFDRVDNLSRALESRDLLQEATTSAHEYFVEALGGYSKFIMEVLNPFIRARLAANLDEVTAFAALTALAPADFLTVTGGLKRLTDRLIRLSEADVQTDAQVTKLRQSTSGGWLVEFVNNSSPHSSPAALGFDFVILAAPFPQNGIVIEPSVFSPVHAPPTNTTRHVTYFASQQSLSASFFGLPHRDRVPEDILTT